MIVALGGPLGRTERAGLALGLLLAAALMWPVRHGMSDTAFIWLQYARHLAHGDGLVFNPGERVHAALNPLWVTLLADAMSLHLDGLAFAKAVGGLSTLLSVALFLQLMRRTVRTPIVRAVATVGWASQAWMAQYSLGGLEASLGVALTIAGFVMLTGARQWGDRPVRTGALWALAALTRPGAVLLLVLFGTALLVDAKNRAGLRRLVFGTLPAVVIYGSWLLFTLLYFGSVWPHVLALQPTTNPTLAEWWRRFAAQASSLAGTEGALALAGAVAFALTRREPHPPHPAPALRLLPLAWVVVLPALVAARGLSVGTRHLLLVLPVIHWLSWQALDRWWSGTRPSSLPWAHTTLASLLLGALVVGQNLHVYRARVVPEVRQTSAALDHSLVRWGRWLGTHAPGAGVASVAPGALAYYGDARVVDLSGLVSPRMLAVRRAVPDTDLVSRLAFAGIAHTDYVVDRGVPSRALLERSPYRAAFELLDEREGAAFYRLHWDRIADAESLHVRAPFGTE